MNQFIENKFDPLGIIAGGGQFPLLVANGAKKQGIPVIAIAHYDETEPSLENYVDKIIWIKLGQFGQIIKAFQKSGVKKAVMAGTITKKRMFGNIKPDLKGIKIISKLAIFHDDNILRAVADELHKEGIEIVNSALYLPELMASAGCLTKKRPSRSEREDIDFGWKIAKELGRLDIGQCVIVRRKTVLALEAIDGTDETILRGGRLAKEKAVVVKVCKPNQDMRFDVPSIGPGTIESMAAVKANVLAIEAGKTLIFDQEETIEYADKHGIVIISL